jgi:hypothetical protein
MPIKPENRARYPKDWPQIRLAILMRARGRCEWQGCTAGHGAIGFWETDGKFYPLPDRLWHAGYRPGNVVATDKGEFKVIKIVPDHRAPGPHARELRPGQPGRLVPAAPPGIRPGAPQTNGLRDPQGQSQHRGDVLMSKLARDHRNRELAMIHMAKAELLRSGKFQSDDDYRAMLWTQARVKSAADLDHAGRQTVLAYLRGMGFNTARAPAAPRQCEPR